MVADCKSKFWLLSSRISYANGAVPNPTCVSESYANNLIAFADSDFAGDVNSRCSTSGWVLVLNGGPVAWRSHLQKSVSTSMTKAELYSLSDCLNEIIFTQRFVATADSCWSSDQQFRDCGL
jgi:hypothetical protein